MSGPARRTVRATPDFFADLDRQLPAETDPDDIPPSRREFQAYELLLIVERFATGFDDLPQPVPGRSDQRVLTTRGRLVLSASVTGQLTPDGAVELLDITIDLGIPDLDPDEDPDAEPGRRTRPVA